jgi:peptidoglycan hydrolase CwlO-like protein
MNGIWIALSALGALISFFALLLSFKASRRRDDLDKTENASRWTRIETMLESVRGGIDDIRIELKTQQKQIGDVTERVARLEEQVKTGERRIEMIEGKLVSEREEKECH